MEDINNELRRLRLAGITFNQINAGVYGLILQEVGGDRRLPIVIGSAEAHSIECKLQEIITPRPLTHDLMTNIFRAFGMQLEQVVIKRLDSGVYAADLHMRLEDERIVIDARSSDAIALAIRVGAPIFTTEGLLETAGVKKNIEKSPQRKSSRKEGEGKPVTYEAKSMSELNEMLASAVDNEQYEEAAVIKRIIEQRKQKDARALEEEI